MRGERGEPATMLDVPANTRFVTLRGETKLGILVQTILLVKIFI